MNTSLSALLPLINDQYGNNRFAIDVGAHHGEFSRHLLQTGFFEKVLAFEPNFESYSAIQSVISSFPSCAFEVVNAALSSESGSLDLYFDGDTATASLLQYDRNYLSRGEIRKYTVSTFTLDEYLDNNANYGRLQFLKIDTQGNDLAVINGAMRSIAQHRPILQVEFIYIPLYEDQCTPDDITAVLTLLEYKMYSLNNLHVTSEGRLAFCDALFIPKELSVPRTQTFSCIDDQISFQSQIQTLTEICAERLTVINVLDAEVQRLNGIVMLKASQ